MLSATKTPKRLLHNFTYICYTFALTNTPVSAVASSHYEYHNVSRAIMQLFVQLPQSKTRINVMFMRVFVVERIDPNTNFVFLPNGFAAVVAI